MERCGLAAFSGCGIFQVAALLGVTYLEKLEEAADWRVTTNVFALIFSTLTVALDERFPGDGTITERVNLDALSRGCVTEAVLLDLMRRSVGAVLMHQRAFRINNVTMLVRTCATKRKR
jgi:hypothetical protein